MTLDHALTAAEEAAAEDRLVLLCFLAGRDVALDAGDLRAALRRSELLLAAGGDPRRPLELRGRAVTALAADLDEPGRRTQLLAGLASLVSATGNLPRAADALAHLTRDTDLAWQCYAMALLGEALADGE